MNRPEASSKPHERQIVAIDGFHQMTQIREALADDAPVIIEFNRRLAWETERKRLDPAKLAAGVAGVFGKPGRGRYFVATTAEGGAQRVVGQLMITYEWSDWRNGDFWWIQSVYVDAGHRRRGVFRALYEYVEALARKKPDVCGLRLYVEVANNAALSTYDNLGFQPSGYVVYEREWS